MMSRRKINKWKNLITKYNYCKRCLGGRASTMIVQQNAKLMNSLLVPTNPNS